MDDNARILTAFDPLLADGLLRLRARVRPDQRDTVRIFQPIFLAITLLVAGTRSGVDAFMRRLPASPFDIDQVDLSEISVEPFGAWIGETP